MCRLVFSVCQPTWVFSVYSVCQQTWVFIVHSVRQQTWVFSVHSVCQQTWVFSVHSVCQQTWVEDSPQNLFEFKTQLKTFLFREDFLQTLVDRS